MKTFFRLSVVEKLKTLDTWKGVYIVIEDRLGYLIEVKNLNFMII